MRSILAAAVLGCSVVLMMPGCGPSEADAAAAHQSRPLSFVIINNSGGEMNDIGVVGSTLPMGFRDLADGQTTTIKSKKLELPETLTVHWSDARGNRREGRVDVWSNLGPTYSGPVEMTVTQRGKVVLGGG